MHGNIGGKGKSSDIDHPIAEFHLFNKLPAEIRLQIWKLDLPGPRIIGIKRVYKPIRILSTRYPITNLAVCQESRYEALKIYELAFPTKKTPAQTYINFSIDTVFINSNSHFKLAEKCPALWKSFSRIRSLAAPYTTARTLGYRDFCSLSSLETILVVQDKRHRSLRTGLQKLSIYHYDEGYIRMPSWLSETKRLVQDRWEFYYEDVLKIKPPPLKISCARVFL